MESKSLFFVKIVEIYVHNTSSEAYGNFEKKMCMSLKCLY